MTVGRCCASIPAAVAWCAGSRCHRSRTASHSVGLVWVALYHESAIVRVDPRVNRILGPPIRAGFPTELLASAGGHLWAIPSVGGSLADPQLHTVLEIDARSGRIVRSYRTRAAPAMSWKPATPPGWRRPSRTSWSASPAQSRGSLRLG